MSMTETQKRAKKRPIISGFIWLGIGLFLLTQTTDILPEIEYSWPVFVIIVGLALILGSFFKSRKQSDSRLDQNVH